jgi:hypothetical protein
MLERARNKAKLQTDRQMKGARGTARTAADDGKVKLTQQPMTAKSRSQPMTTRPRSSPHSKADDFKVSSLKRSSRRQQGQAAEDSKVKLTQQLMTTRSSSQCS